MSKTIKNSIIGAVITLIISAFGKAFYDISENTYYSKFNHSEIKELKDKIKEIQYEQKSMPDLYVTRREFQIVIDNLNKKLEKSNKTLERLADKL